MGAFIPPRPDHRRRRQLFVWAIGAVALCVVLVGILILYVAVNLFLGPE